MFALAGAPERPKSAASGDVPSAVEQQQLQQLAALTEKVVAAAVAAKQQEVAQLVAGVASKYGLAADYGKAEETIKAVWAEQVGAAGGGGSVWSGQHPLACCLHRLHLAPAALPVAGTRGCSPCRTPSCALPHAPPKPLPNHQPTNILPHPPASPLQGPVSRANSAANTAPSAPKQQSQQQQQQQQQPQATGAGSEELTLGGQQGKGSSDNVSCGEEEAGQQATSTLKAQGVRADASEPANALKRPMAAAPGFSFRAPADEPGMGAAPGQGAGAKKRRVQYDRMQELEAKVQRVRHLGDALKQSLRQVEAQVGGLGWAGLRVGVAGLCAFGTCLTLCPLRLLSAAHRCHPGERAAVECSAAHPRLAARRACRAPAPAGGDACRRHGGRAAAAAAHGQPCCPLAQHPVWWPVQPR